MLPTVFSLCAWLFSPQVGVMGRARLLQARQRPHERELLDGKKVVGMKSWTLILMSWGLSAGLVALNRSLAVGLSRGLTLVAFVQGFMALALLGVLLLRLSKRQRVGFLWPWLPALLSAAFYLNQYPYFVNQRVERIGPTRLIEDTADLCKRFSETPWEQRDKENWKRVQVGDPRLPESLRQLQPFYVSVYESHVDLKMGGYMDTYQGIEIEPEAAAGGSGKVDWSQTWSVRSYREDGLYRTRRIIAPGILWETWSAP